MSTSEGLDQAEGAPTRFMVAAGGVVSEGYGHDGAMVRLRSKKCRRMVDVATRCSGVCPLVIMLGVCQLRRVVSLRLGSVAADGQ